MAEAAFPVPDPRVFRSAAAAPSAARSLYALADAGLGAVTGQQADAIDRELRPALATLLADDAAALADAIARAPSVAVARHLWRALDALWRAAAESAGAGLAVTVFALPLVIVAGAGSDGGESELPGVLGDPAKVAAVLLDAGALAGNRTIAFADALVAADAIDVARLPELSAWRRLPDALAPGLAPPVRMLNPAPLAVRPGGESVHLRFLVGTAVARPGVDLLADARMRNLGVPLARELDRQLSTGGATVLVLPRPPQRPLPAIAQGRAAQREVSAQIFASNAIRKFRGSVGEPSAIISAHRAPDAPGGGELRLSLSSPLDPAAAEGFRCPLYPIERAGDGASMLVDLLRDCRVTDIRMLAGVHADRRVGSRLPLLFKTDTIPESASVSVFFYGPEGGEADPGG